MSALLADAQDLEQANGDGVDLFASGTARHPDAHRIVGRTVLQQCGEHAPVERLEGIGIAKEVGHPDQQVLHERALLVGVLLQQLQVIWQRLSMVHGHTPGQATFDRAAFVVREVHPRGVAQQPEYRFEVLLVGHHARAYFAYGGCVLERGARSDIGVIADAQ